ncbi:MAG: fluoride efflux transporter CrcB [Xanthomonadales bacterium]|uniref:fluoride efflux transporter CrcB n=1 Tax=Dokdonella sp. TaxID=2291710 RepID=UPI002BB1D265|nr:fluoride efflux transporter CrcB [Xanthomonadales bacterium]HQV72211.1 fluoride efflux transporter CrcB [Dokdonella sp.]MBK7013204.1 fluoride efflux transporter CrcB [Xanthomonadales bacterium]MBK7211645.1 fluoride efflux transporter CrcB [Xanthomonadales bacterium]MBL0221192.1 fluoride efflux transporter CrcB [Xanthomonadales bacterium]
MNLLSPIAVAGGAGIGALIRWIFGLALDAIFPAIPLGTLLANVLGGFLMGLVIGSIDQFQTLPLEWRLALTTGFLGGLTTFSTFSGETLNHLLRQQWGWAGALVFVHVAGSILAALLGVVVIRAIVPQ